MNCPNCNWDTGLTSRSVSPRGYHSHYVCKGVTDCSLRFEVTVDLYLAYERGMLPEELRSKAERLLLHAGKLATPP